MNPPRLAVVDYGMGNIHSVAKSLEAAGGRVVVSDRRTVLDKADVLVVPGQGRFDRAMATLKERGLISFLKGWLRDDRPFLGVCLGLQILFDRSDEAPGAPGLGWIPGRVRRFAPGSGLKIPHMGWNRARPVGDRAQKLFGADGYYYFVHSYYPVPAEGGWEGTRTPYGTDFCSAIVRGAAVATQFHPEKSGTAGLLCLKKLIQSWARR